MRRNHYFKATGQMRTYCGLSFTVVRQEIEEVTCLNCLKVIHATVSRLQDKIEPLRVSSAREKQQPLFQ